MNYKEMAEKIKDEIVFITESSRLGSIRNPIGLSIRIEKALESVAKAEYQRGFSAGLKTAEDAINLSKKVRSLAKEAK